MSQAAQLHQQALAAEKAGDGARAQALYARAIDADPEDAGLVNSVGVAHLRMAEPARAAELFAKARELDPAALDYAINLAIALGRVGRHREAAMMLAGAEDIGRDEPRYWSARGNAERLCYEFAAAQASYDEVLQRDPGHVRALHGRARVALERGQVDTLERIERAISAAPGDAGLWQAKALALDVAGRNDEAVALMRQVIAQAPHWIEGLETLAQLRLAGGDTDFASHFADATKQADPPDAIYLAWAKTLGGLDFFAEAVEIAARARNAAHQTEVFALLEAVYAGMAGDAERAERIFAQFRRDTRDWVEHGARHDIRMGRIEQAEAALGGLIEAGGPAVNLWALRDVCWRLVDDPRHEWLHGREELVRPVALADQGVLDEATDFLRELHRGSALPLGQSVRGGTQTRGRLFQREEPVLARLRAAIVATLEAYREELPERDDAHPVLRYRDEPWRITHSWSVRLPGAGFHTSHIHPLGVLSSALYLVVPPAVDDEDCPGHLEIGRPPPDLRTELEPLRVIKPERGKLALFPSTLYHGTRNFAEGERMTVAFDVSAGDVG